MTGQHYGRSQLAAEIMRALSEAFPAEHRCSVTELARLDQFHTRGLAATADLARSAGVTGPGGLDFTIALGTDFPTLTANLRHTLSAGAVGIVAAIMERA